MVSFLGRHIKAIPSPPSTAKKYPFPQQEWQNMQMEALDSEGSRTRLFAKDNPIGPKPGDILLCTFKSGEPFSGVCLSIRRRGVDTAVLLRNRLVTTGVEMYVKIYSPNVRSIEIVKRAEKRARRARLYYMRQPKHDRGSVEGVVQEYMRKKRLLRSGTAGDKNLRGRKQTQQGKGGPGAR